MATGGRAAEFVAVTNCFMVKIQNSVSRRQLLSSRCAFRANPDRPTPSRGATIY